MWQDELKLVPDGWQTLPVGDVNNRDYRRDKQPANTFPWSNPIKWKVGEWDEVGYGIVIPQGYVVVDIDDERVNEEFVSFFSSLLAIDPTEFVADFYVKTPKGYHYWFKTEYEFKNNAGMSTFGKGLDIRAAGKGYVVGPNFGDKDTYEEGTKAYHRYGSWEDIPEMPLALYEKMFPSVEEPKKVEVEAPVRKDTGPVIVPEGTRNSTLNELIFGCIINAPGSDETMREVGHWVNEQLGSSKLPAEEIDNMLKSIYPQRATRNKDCIFVPMVEHPMYYGKEGFRQRILTQALVKLGYKMRHNVRSDSPQYWNGKKWDDIHELHYGSALYQCRTKVMTGGKLYKKADGKISLYPLTFYNWTKADIRSSMHMMQSQNQIDPFVADYLEKLEWDGTPRITSLLSEFFDVSDNPPEIIEYVSQLLMKGAVNRCLNPGCKHDEMVVFIGGEGCFKSSFFQYLVPERKYFEDNFTFNDERKDIVEKTLGKVIVEASEMRDLTSRNSDKVKNILSAQEDTVRLSYRTDAIRYPRRFIFVGTSNSSSVLPSDPEGNRRFVPIFVKRHGDSYKDLIAKMHGMRDQLWAEAVATRGDVVLTKEMEERLKSQRMKYSWNPEAEDILYDQLTGFVGTSMFDWQCREMFNVPTSITDRKMREIMKHHPRCISKRRRMEKGRQSWFFEFREINKEEMYAAGWEVVSDVS